MPVLIPEDRYAQIVTSGFYPQVAMLARMLRRSRLSAGPE